MQGITDQKSAATASTPTVTASTTSTVEATLINDKKDQKSSPAPVVDTKLESKCDKTLQEHKGTVFALAVLPDGRLASGSSDKSIKLWDTKTGQCLQTLVGHDNGVQSLIIMPNDRIASGAYKEIKLWNANSGECVSTIDSIWTRHSNWVTALMARSDGMLLSGSFDNTMKQWSIRDGELNYSNTFEDHRGPIRAIVEFPDGETASGSDDKSIIISTKWRSLVFSLRGHTDCVYALTVLKDGRLASGSADTTIKLWDPKTGKCLQSLGGHDNAVAALAVLKDGRLASGSHDKTIKLWDAQTGKCVETLSGHTSSVCALTVLSDGRLVSGSWDESIKLWNVETPALQLQATAAALQLPTKNNVTNDTKDKSEAEAKADKEKREMQEKLDAQTKQLADMQKILTDMQVQKPTSPTPQPAPAIVVVKPAAPTDNISVSLNINYNDIKLGDEIGKGGFGIVYRGTWKHNQVAVKQLLAAPTGDALKDFKEEMQTHASLRSDHIVQLYGCCLGPYCMVMQYMPRGSLSNYLKEHRTKDLDWNIGYKIITDMACGLAFLHDNEIVHRDLKSLNVLLDENYHAKLSDFGLAKIKHESKTMLRYGGSAGTTAWMAPELFGRKAVYTKKADIYSLGITFWEIAARKIPFEDAADPSIIPTWVKDGEREEIPASCPPKLASLIKFCWNGKPEERPTAARIVEYLRSDEKEFSLSSKTNNIAAVTATAVSTPFFAASYQANSNAAQVNNVASASFAASYQVNTPVMKK